MGPNGKLEVPRVTLTAEEKKEVTERWLENRKMFADVPHLLSLDKQMTTLEDHIVKGMLQQDMQNNKQPCLHFKKTDNEKDKGNTKRSRNRKNS